MNALRTVTKWLHIDKWLRAHRLHFSGAGAGLAVMAAWILTGSFWRGVGLVVFLMAAWFVVLGAKWLVHRVRVTTEAGIPISPVRMVKELLAERAKFTDADHRWALAMRAQKVVYDGQSPKLHRKTQTATGDVQASINLAGIGGDLDVITRLAASGTLAGIMHCQEVSVQPSTKLGRAKITFYKSPPLQRSFTLADLPASGKHQVSFGIDESGAVAALRYGLSAIIAGATGSGKSVLFWNMFADILRDGQPTEILFVDPKRMELRRFKDLVGHKIGNVKIAGYCNSAADAGKMFEQFVVEMHERQERLGVMGVTELTRPTEAFPIRIIVIDEMLDITPTFKNGSALHIAISQGRSSLDSVIGIAQLAKINSLGDIRDLFPLRACLRTMTAENTKAVLNVTENEGVPCSRIPLDARGVGYYVTDTGIIRKFRTAKVTDRQRDELVAGKLPEGMPVNVENIGPPCFVYLAPERKSQKVGYVGVAGGNALERHPVARRRAQHRKYDLTWCAEHERVENFWTTHLDDTRMTVYKYPSRSAALVAEERLIKELRPKWNIVHNGANPLANVNLAKRAGVRFRARDAGGQYVELGREAWALHQVKAGYRHSGRVEQVQAKRERFYETVTEESYR